MDLSVNEIFPSFQGEGIHTGLPTTFIRLAGCNLRCKWCDTSYALSTKNGSPMGIDDILRAVNEIGIELICLTGGEPLFQEGAYELVKELIKGGFKVDLETNGSFDIGLLSDLGPDIMISMDVKTPSSGADMSFHNENIEKIRKQDQIKFIVEDDADLEFTLDMIGKESPKCNIIITPVSNEGGDRIAERLMSSVLKGEIPLTMRLMVQTHKVIWGPDKRGV